MFDTIRMDRHSILRLKLTLRSMLLVIFW